MNFKKQFVALLVLVACALTTFAQQMPPIPMDPNVRVGKLENGLTYYIRYNNYPEGQANFYIAQKVGSSIEEDNQRGLAHFLEHMCFNGTEKFPGNGVVKYLESIGVKFGGDLNAYTSIDETVYNIDNVPMSVAGAVDSCLWILHDWAGGLLLEDEDIDKERGVIHEEWRQRNTAQQRMMEAVSLEMYPGNRYGDRWPIGTMEVIDNFPYQALRDYYEKWYRPDQQAIVVVGDINVDEIENKIKDIFADLTMPENPAERVYFPIADNKEPIIAIAQDKEQQYGIVYLFAKHEAIPNEAKGDMQYLILDYAKSMFAQMMHGRMNELAMQPDAPFVEGMVSDGEFFLAKTKGAVNGAIVPKEGKMKESVAVLYREMLRAQRHGFTESEYVRARAEYLTNLESAYNERAKERSQRYCKEYVRHFIDNEPMPGIEIEYSIMSQYAPNLPVELVNQVVASLMSDTNLVVMAMLPEKEGLVHPTKEEIAQLLADVAAEDITAYEDKVSDEPLIAEEPAGGKVVKVKEAKHGYKQLTLSNGATVYLKSTDFKADQIMMSVVSKGGTALYDASEAINLGQVVDVIENNGIGNFSTTDLQKVLAGKKARVAPYINLNMEGMNGSSTPKDFETLMQLTYLQFTAPRLDDEAFASYKSKMKAMLENQELDPQTALGDTITKVLYNNHPRAISMKAADVEKTDDARILEIYKERFANAADFSFIFTGAIDEAVAIPLIEKYIGGLPAGGKKEKIVDAKVDIQKGEIKNIFEKQMATPSATVYLVYSGKMKHNLKNVLMMSVTDQILDIIYTEEIREKEGGTYGVGTSGSITRVPKETFRLLVMFQTAPELREKLTGIAVDLLNKYAEEGPRQKDLDKVREYMLKKYAENQKENSYWANMLHNEVVLGYDGYTDYEKTLNSITTEDLKNFMKSLLKQGNAIEVSMVGVK
ncbi:MAG: insulinase family protein [Bacteroidaceae bacterium]|nr:insulinase family protein [Bacteroidaceae bacterium]